MCVCVHLLFPTTNTTTAQHSIAQRFNSSSLDLKLVSEWFGFYIPFFLSFFLSFFCLPQHNLASNTSNWTIIWFAFWWCTTWSGSGNAWCCRNYEYLRCKYSFYYIFSEFFLSYANTVQCTHLSRWCAPDLWKLFVWLFPIKFISLLSPVRLTKGYDELLGIICGATAEGVFVS